MKNVCNVCGIFFEIGKKKIAQLATLRILPYTFCQGLMKIAPAHKMVLSKIEI
jgi:hypothetical protein